MDGLDRFIGAQQYDYVTALREIQAGRKQSHWVWYVFPQLKGLGQSYNSNYYGLEDVSEAKRYWEHPVLGARLKEITQALLAHHGEDVYDILGGIDAKKVKSCMTLFHAATGEQLFMDVLQEFYRGSQCRRTLSMLNGGRR